MDEDDDGDLPCAVVVEGELGGGEEGEEDQFVDEPGQDLDPVAKADAPRVLQGILERLPDQIEGQGPQEPEEEEVAPDHPQDHRAAQAGEDRLEGSPEEPACQHRRQVQGREEEQRPGEDSVPAVDDENRLEEAAGDHPRADEDARRHEGPHLGGNGERRGPHPEAPGAQGEESGEEQDQEHMPSGASVPGGSFRGGQEVAEAHRHPEEEQGDRDVQVDPCLLVLPVLLRWQGAREDRSHQQQGGGMGDPAQGEPSGPPAEGEARVACEFAIPVEGHR